MLKKNKQLRQRYKHDENGAVSSLLLPFILNELFRQLSVTFRESIHVPCWRRRRFATIMDVYISRSSAPRAIKAALIDTFNYALCKTFARVLWKAQIRQRTAIDRASLKTLVDTLKLNDFQRSHFSSRRDHFSHPLFNLCFVSAIACTAAKAANRVS